ncbi:hypothetical protein [Prosthecobacter sp.]|uniref:hypothetical protein n=1 Tax=Prosthecobacter sp. TaxID=1965333 RepID=UPI003904ACD7
MPGINFHPDPKRLCQQRQGARFVVRWKDLQVWEALPHAEWAKNKTKLAKK